MGLDEYCMCHSTSIDALINKVNIDIDILQKRMTELYPKDLYKFPPIFDEVHTALKKKKTHLDRLTEWKVETEFASSSKQ